MRSLARGNMNQSPASNSSRTIGIIAVRQRAAQRTDRPLVVETWSLTKSYGSVAALGDCSLGVPEGEVFGLLGPNGAGKTTLLRLILG